MSVYFIGAGPGDPKLITLKGREIIDQADIIIYAGSLVNPEVLVGHKETAKIYDSASMTLEEVLEVIKNAYSEGKTIARVHTGDPSLFGAIKEQMDQLDNSQIPFEVIPGVSSFLAAAASLKAEYTLPGVSQSLIITRMEGRTPVPDRERLSSFAQHKTSMAIFLSTGLLDEVVKELISHYEATTPVAVVYKASWPEEHVIRGYLKDISQKVKEADINKTALIIVGDFLDTAYERSKLYDPTFTHEFREASK